MGGTADSTKRTKESGPEISKGTRQATNARSGQTPDTAGESTRTNWKRGRGGKRMTCEQLAKIIVERIIEQSKQQPDPQAYFAKAVERACYLQQNPPEDATAELMKFGFEFGLLSPKSEKVN